MSICPICRTQYPPGSQFCPTDGHRLEEIGIDFNAQHDRFIGTIIDDRYKIESRLGQGGMGIVYAARHTVIDRPVAIKILRHEYCQNKALVERFMLEARAASRIGHPNIVDITDFGSLPDGHIYFVMEYLVGHTLSKELREVGHFPLPRIVDLATQICQALGAAHAKGIIHRDLKPENIFILNPCNDIELDVKDGYRRDFVKLLDFGIAKISWSSSSRLTKVGSIFGTPQYMSPEQAQGRDTDHRSDIYSLGCIIYEMVTGEVPFVADTFMGTLTKHMFDPPIPPRELRPDVEIPEAVDHIILKALAKDPNARFQTMADVGRALLACIPAVSGRTPSVFPIATVNTGPIPYIADVPLEPWRTQSMPPPSNLQRKNSLPLVAFLVAMLLGGGVVGIMLLQNGSPNPSPAQTNGNIDVTKTAVLAKTPDLSTRPLLDSGAKTDPATTMVTIKLLSKPTGATVYENGKRLGKTPLSIKATSGENKVYVFKKVIKIKAGGEEGIRNPFGTKYLFSANKDLIIPNQNETYTIPLEKHPIH